MRRWFEVLRDREDDRGGGGSDVIRDRVDMGAPQEVGVDHEPPDDEPGRTVKKTATEVQLEELQAENARNKRRADDAEEDSRYWAARGRRAAADADETPQPRTPAAPAAVAVVEMTPEELVEGLNKEGLQALRKAGFISQAEFDAKLDDLRTELTGYVQGQRSDAEFNGRIATEFPTIARESAKVAKDPRYKSDDPLFLRTGEIYREMIADDAKLEKSPGTIMAAARAATRELQAEGKGPARGGRRDEVEQGANRGPGPVGARRDETPARRRDRIERQRPDRGADNDEERGGGDQFTAEQQSVMKHLNVKPEKFVAHRDAGLSQESRRGRR